VCSAFCFHSSTQSSRSSANFIHEVNKMRPTCDGNNTSFPKRLLTPITFNTFMALFQYFLFDARVYLQGDYIVSPEFIYYNIVEIPRTFTSHSNAVHLSCKRIPKSQVMRPSEFVTTLHTERCPEAPPGRIAMCSVHSKRKASNKRVLQF
jgi:hypothetical protein